MIRKSYPDMSRCLQRSNSSFYRDEGVRKNYDPSPGLFSEILEKIFFPSPKSPGCQIWKYEAGDTFKSSLQVFKRTVMN